jgi:hypothetical protein
MPKRNMICSQCGSDEVLRDAYASWCIETQQWVLDNVFDYAHCRTCDEETNIEEIECKDTPADLLHAALDDHFKKKDSA